VVAEFRNPVMLYSIGKDSERACASRAQGVRAGEAAVPLLHVDTTWKFKDMYAFREFAREYGFELAGLTNPTARPRT
jgi:sulfate adenylyltransferase subunit 2